MKISPELEAIEDLETDTDTASRVFLGLALGDVAMMVFWIVVNGLTNHQGYQLMPG